MLNNILYQDHPIIKNKDWLLGVLHIYNAAIEGLHQVTLNTVCWDILQKINRKHAELTANTITNDYKNGMLEAAHYFVKFFSPNNGQISSIKDKLIEMLDLDVEQLYILISSTSEQHTSVQSSLLYQVKPLTDSPSLS
jgi:succinate dehydrogenase flavin-adding protein (antitoxin of CptAB toxin-antitoxin module)